MPSLSRTWPRRAVAALMLAIAGALCAAALSSAWSVLPASASARPEGATVAQPETKWDPIPYDARRKRQMANYSHRHYGDRTWRLEDPQAVVLHYTATSTYPPVFNAFAANAPSLGEAPGTCAQFVVDKDGTIYQLTRLYVRCRHTVGLNHVAIGVEMVQEELGTRNGSDQAILGRLPQVRAAAHLVAWLKTRYGIPMTDVIGHAMANGSHLFKDLEGWRNDHVDWRPADVRDFRDRVATVIHRG
ncbi:MAG: N-acetylmuramoyl-L-alanine amidase [Solirubrobacterales bacterium]|nr:N-acetylmuramoyl-L-alanine amidase [Solirubrobacterales bacterium]